jgi:5-methylcytosine-specific restriction endonuclease McrA
MQSTLKVSKKTHSGMLPQSRTLEVPVDDPAKVKAGTRGTAPALTAFQHGRGERPVQKTGPSPSLKREEIAGSNSRIFVRASNEEPLMPCHPARARQLLKSNRARVHKLYPFAIRLTDRKDGAKQPVVFKVDPGAKTTGLALNCQDQSNPTKQSVLHLAELTHRSTVIRDAIVRRRAYRRRRRNANLRYRAARFDNRKRKEGWLPPSLQSRADNILSWFSRYAKLAPITSVEIESVRFDTQAIQNPEISGKEYQQGTLYGYELREYLLEKWGRKCAYCDASNIPLQIEHIVPRSPKNHLAQRGSNRVSNLTLACDACNKEKGNNSIQEFLADQPDRLGRILSHTKKPLQSTAAVNTTRKELFNQLRQLSSLPITGSSGGRTKFNRSKLGIPKTHALDAACVGEVSYLSNWQIPVLHIKATGRGSYQRTRLTKYGFPRGYLPHSKSAFGFRTGDLVKARVRTGKKAGTHFGRVAVRTSGSFNIQTALGTIQGISHRHCHRVQSSEGYTTTPIPPVTEVRGFLGKNPP